MQDMVLLHNHDAKGSLLDSILKIEDMVKFAKENNQKSIAITNHGTMFSFVDFYKACKKYNIKPIIGVEAYEVDDMLVKDSSEKRGHLILLVKNQIGLKNLYKIVSDSYKLGFYYKPRIDLDYIKDNSLGEGIICLTACQAGRLSRGLMDNKDMKPYFEKLKSTFDYAAVEIQSHNTEDQIIANNKIINFAKENNYPFTITTDSHMKSKDKMKVHGIFVEIGESREVGEMYEGCYLQTPEEIHNYMDKHHGENIITQAIKETVKISDMIEEVDIGLNAENQMPKINHPKGFNSNMDYFRHLLKQGLVKKNINKKREQEQRIYLQRIEDEIPVLEALDYIDYFIMLYMLAQESDKRGIPRGYSRGSGANCLCLYLLGVTQVDSIKWDLDFSRFANLGRKSVGDFDWDISKKRRKEMIEISKELFGEENVAPICTFNTLSSKVAIRDIGKVLDLKKIYNIPYNIRNEVANLIPTVKTFNDLGEEEEKDLLLKEVLSSNKKLKQYHEQYPLWLEYVLELEGLPKSLGKHAAGTIIAPRPIIEYCPICLDKDGNYMLQLEMHNAMDDLSLIKMDYLGLKNLDIIDEALRLSNKTWEDVDIDHLNLHDKDVYEDTFKSGNTVGIFQMESAEATRMCVEAKTDDIEDVIAICAFNRPGTKDGFPTYIQNKIDPTSVEVLHEDLKTIFNKTHFVLLYQEQALQVFRYAGFAEDEVDNARRCVDENTLILMGDGDRKKIKNIKVGDYVMSLNNNIIVPNKVNNVFDNGIQKTYKIKTQHGNKIVGTGDHKVLTQDGWKKIKDITYDDWIMTPKKIQSLQDDIKSNKKPDACIMFMLGLLIGDGTLKNPNNIHFTNSEMRLISEYKKCVNVLSRSKEECEFTTLKQEGVNVDYIYSVYVKSKGAKQRLKTLISKYDLNCYAGDKKIPNEFMSYPLDKKLSSLIAGLFNTDGGYNKGIGTIEYYSKSRTLAYQIKSLLLKYGIYSYIDYKKADGYDYNIYTLRIKQLNSLILFKKEILPYVIGRKHDDYKKIIEDGVVNLNKYNFMMPEKNYREIIESTQKMKASFSDIGDYIGGYKNNGFKLSKNSNITDIKARKIIQYINCPDTYNLLTSDYFPLKVIEIEEDGYRHVFDLEIENDHNYIANELIVHNCIGHKEKETMKTLKTQLINGLKNKGWTEDQANSMWILLEKQAEYSFNRGHSVAYGLLSYLTAYLKHYCPLEFMTASLNADVDNISKLSISINECDRLNIKVLPPNINDSKEYFTARKKTNDILFGIIPIKGIGETTAKTIIENQPYKSFTNFCEKVKPTKKIDKSDIITLIKAGSFTISKKRDYLLKYAESICKIKEYSDVTTLPTIKILKDDWGIVADNKEDRLLQYNIKRKIKHDLDMKEKHIKSINSFKNKYMQDEYMWEFDTLSMFLTNNPLSAAYKYVKPFDDVDSGSKAVAISIIVNIKNKKDKNNNKFAYLDLYTPFGIIESICWASKYSKYQDFIKKGSAVAILGRKNEGKLFVEEIKSFEGWKVDKGFNQEGF